MILKDMNKSYTPNKEPKRVSMQEMYNLLTNENIVNEEGVNKKVIDCIIAWLPNITEICVTQTFDNNWLDIAFTNNQVMRFYNIGIEYSISDLVD